MPLFGTFALSFFPYSLDDVSLLYILFVVPLISIYALSRMPRRLLQCAALRIGLTHGARRRAGHTYTRRRGLTHTLSPASGCTTRPEPEVEPLHTPLHTLHTPLRTLHTSLRT